MTGGGQNSIGIRMIFGTIFVSIETLFLYAPNILRDTCGGVHHATAYITSIVNVLHRTPYEYWTTSIYGHYALLYSGPVSILKFFGINQWIAIAISIALFGAICFITETFLFHKLIKNDTLYILALVANALICTQIYRGGEYWQVNPHRKLFPALILTLIYGYYKADLKREKFYAIVLWIAASCSLIWNTEVGIVCVFIVFLAYIYKQSVKSNKISLLIIIQNIIIMLLSCLMAYWVVNFYNKIVGGGHVSFKEYIYPIGSVEYDIEMLWLPLGTPFIGYFFAMVLFLGVICFYMKKSMILKADNSEIMCMFCSVLGLGVMVYYMNRPVNSNMSIVAFEVVFVLVVLLDKNIHTIQDASMKIKNINFSCVFYVIGMFILTSMCLSTIGSIGFAFEAYSQTVYNTEQLPAIIETLEEILPENSRVAFVGKSSAIFSSLLDRDKGIYVIDYEDRNPQGLQYIKDELASCQYDYIFWGNVNEGELALPDDYQFDDYQLCEKMIFENMDHYIYVFRRNS